MMLRTVYSRMQPSVRYQRELLTLQVRREMAPVRGIRPRRDRARQARRSWEGAVVDGTGSRHARTRCGATGRRETRGGTGFASQPSGAL